jgi:hypothetical protein
VDCVSGNADEDSRVPADGTVYLLKSQVSTLVASVPARRLPCPSPSVPARACGIYTRAGARVCVGQGLLKWETGETKMRARGEAVRFPAARFGLELCEPSCGPTRFRSRSRHRIRRGLHARSILVLAFSTLRSSDVMISLAYLVDWFCRVGVTCNVSVYTYALFT